MQVKSPEKVIVKVGSGIVATDSGRIKRTHIRQIAHSVCGLRERGHTVHVVSSGAIACGKYQLSHNKHSTLNPSSFPNQQALAAIGQSYLISEYSRAFARYSPRNTPVAQILLTHLNFKTNPEKENIANTFGVIEKLGAVALINENDVVATEELRTDNDYLALLIGRLIGADRLVMISNSGGLRDQHGDVVPVVSFEDHDRFKYFIDDNISSNGRGGMESKYEVACLAAEEGIHVNIIGETDIERLENVFSEEFIGTHFEPRIATT